MLSFDLRFKLLIKTKIFALTGINLNTIVTVLVVCRSKKGIKNKLIKLHWGLLEFLLMRITQTRNSEHDPSFMKKY